MGGYLLRRLSQSALTIFGVMLLTFLLFRVVAGDVTAQYVNPKQGEQARETFREKHGLDRPWYTQFGDHLWNSATFSGKSYATDETLSEIISERAPFSLAITVPALVLGWVVSMVISCVVAYYRGTWIDHAGVFLSVLGMCVPYLAYMILVQRLVFWVAPERAWGLGHPSNIYVPVAVAVVAGLGTSVRFYRTVILDQVNQDYVRTARAKGVSLPSILFRHVLRNCMLPILTNLVLAIPFLIMGSLVLERFFGVPGLGDLMINSISQRDVPIITGLTFLTSLIYVGGLLATDLLYAVFDPRVRLR